MESEHIDEIPPPTEEEILEIIEAPNKMVAFRNQMDRLLSQHPNLESKIFTGMVI